MKVFAPFFWFVLLVLVGSACADGEQATPLSSTVVVSDLDGPTQIAIAPDGAWFVSQLAGGENESSGQVVRVDLESPDGPHDVVLKGLDKPTGVAVFEGRLWVMERNRLINTALDGADLVVVVDDMVFNGRSQGTLTVDGNRLLFNTSGRLSQRTETVETPATSSGVLWAIESDGAITAVASGFKHAYALTRGPDDTLWTTELADGQFDGEPARDEVVAVQSGLDHGWPHCVGDNRVVAEFGGTSARCADVPRSQAVFPFGATPTGLAVAPWDQDQLLVTLWTRGEVVSIAASSESAPADPTVVFTGAERPQYLLVDGDRVLLVDHASGDILALRRE